MSTTSIIRQSDFLGRLVLDQNTAEEVGRVAELWLDPKSHQIIGLSCKSGLLGTSRHSFTWSQIESIGEDSIMVSALAGVNAEKPEDAIGLIAQDIWTDHGNQVGGLIDYRFDPETGDILDYVFVFNGWRSIADSGYCLPPSAVVSMNSKRMIVTEAAIQNSERFVGRLDQGIASIKNFLKADYARTQQDIQTIAHQLQGITQRATAQLKGALPNVSGQLQTSSDPAADHTSDRMKAEITSDINQAEGEVLDATLAEEEATNYLSPADQTTFEDVTIATTEEIVEAPKQETLQENRNLSEDPETPH